MSPSLLALVNMILDGENIKHHTQLSNGGTTNVVLTIAQLLVFNSVKHVQNVETASVCHSCERKTTHQLYLSLRIHAVTRSRSLIDTLFRLRLCFSSDQLLQLTADIVNGVCQQFKLYAHPSCDTDCSLLGLLIILTIPLARSATTNDSLHSTGILQHQSHTNGVLDRGVVVIGQNMSSANSVTPLPLEYTTVSPPAMNK